MKILCLSDLHLRMADILDVIHQRRFTPFLQSIRDLVEDTKPDVAVVTGDTVPPPFVNSLNAFFGSLFPLNSPWWRRSATTNSGDAPSRRRWRRHATRP